MLAQHSTPRSEALPHVVAQRQVEPKLHCNFTRSKAGTGVVAPKTRMDGETLPEMPKEGVALGRKESLRGQGAHPKEYMAWPYQISAAWGDVGRREKGTEAGSGLPAGRCMVWYELSSFS